METIKLRWLKSLSSKKKEKNKDVFKFTRDNIKFFKLNFLYFKNEEEGNKFLKKTVKKRVYSSKTIDGIFFWSIYKILFEENLDFNKKQYSKCFFLNGYCFILSIEPTEVDNNFIFSNCKKRIFSDYNIILNSIIKKIQQGSLKEPDSKEKKEKLFSKKNQKKSSSQEMENLLGFYFESFEVIRFFFSSFYKELDLFLDENVKCSLDKQSIILNICLNIYYELNIL